MLTTIKGEIKSNIIILGDSNSQFIAKERLSEQKTNKEALSLNNTLDSKT